MVESRLLNYAGCFLVGTVVLVCVTVVVVLVVGGPNRSSSESKGSRVVDSLRFIIVMSRHGNRVAHLDYPNDPYPINNTYYWPYGEDSLTPMGRVEMYKLGVKLRSLYNGFLNTTLYPDELHASSTYMDRMLMSGETFLAGLYPPRGFQIWNKEIAWQPSPLYSDSPDKTLVINQCPRYLQLIEQIKVSFMETYAANLSSIISYYNEMTGSTDVGVQAASNIFNFWDKIISEDTEGYAIPDWTKKLYPEPLKNLIAVEYIEFYAGTDEVVKLLVGSLFREMADVMKGVINGSLAQNGGRKIQYYSGHDSSIVSLQVLLGIPKTSVIGLVNFGSAIILEIHQNSITGQYTLQTLYIDGKSSDLEPVTLNVPDCGEPCDLPTLINITRRFTDVDYDHECLNTTFS